MGEAVAPLPGASVVTSAKTSVVSSVVWSLAASAVVTALLSVSSVVIFRVV